MGKFYHDGIELDVPEMVYYPREDSLLIAKVLENTDVKGKTVLEIGCGSGFLSVLLAKKGASVTAVDISEEAVETTKTNAETNGTKITILKSDLFSSVGGKFGLIVFNPPYLPVEDGETDFTYAGGLSGRETIERFVSGVKDYLLPNGIVLIVISSLTGEKETTNLFEKEGMKSRVVAREKIPWEELIVLESSQARAEASLR